MNVTKCENGHFFDSDKYDKCPHCGALAIEAKGADKDKNNKKTHKLPWGKKEEKNSEPKAIAFPEGDLTHTFGLFADDIKEGNQTAQAREDKTECILIEEPVKKENAYVPPEPVMSTPPVRETYSSVRDEINQISAESGGKTVGYFNMGTSRETVTEPVVGLLLCIKGEHFGEGFHLVSGRNSVGRAAGNHVVLEKEKSVSREKHAWIVYEPKKREFYIQPGESSGLTYVNGDNLMMPQKLSAFDKIEFGDSNFLLFPICGEQFSWEDYMDKGEE